VLEGSTLGGRYILAKLPPALAPLRGRATAFLEGYGAETGARWRAFGEIALRAIGSAADVDAAEDEAVAGACETFARLIDWLALHEPLARPARAIARPAAARRPEVP
jgi:heme oxygenase